MEGPKLARIMRLHQEYQELFKQVKSVILEEGECITSYEVTTLFTSVPVYLTTSII